MKYIIILAIILANYGCDNAYPKEEEPKQTQWDYLWNLRRDASKDISDSFNKYMDLSIVKAIQGQRDSSSFYHGKAEAYFTCEKIVWPIYPSDYPHPTKK